MVMQHSSGLFQLAMNLTVPAFLSMFIKGVVKYARRDCFE
jgi:hypothetical protein